MSAHPGVSYAWLIRVHSWSVEKHRVKRCTLSEGRKLCINTSPKGGFAMQPANEASYTTLTVPFCHSEWCVPSKYELSRLAALLYVIVCPIFLRICSQLVAINIHEHSFVVKCRNIRKSSHPPFWQTCKMLRPWVLFHETMV